MGELLSKGHSGVLMPANYIKESKLASPDGKVNNFDDLALIKDIFGEGINEFADAEEWIDAWGSTIEPQENFITHVGCHVEEVAETEGAKHLAMAGAAIAISAYLVL